MTRIGARRRGVFTTVGLIIAVSCFTASASPAPCTAYSFPTAVRSADTGEFSGMFPTEYGNLLFCGTSVHGGASEIRVHFLGSSDIWMVSAAPDPTSASVAVSVGFGAFGTINYVVQLPGFEFTLSNSTVTNCSDVINSNLLKAINDAQQYFDDLTALPTTMAQFTLNLTLAEALNEYTASPRLLADCQDALSRLQTGWGCNQAPLGCSYVACSNCCSAEDDRRVGLCWTQLEKARNARSWWQNLQSLFGGDPDNAEATYERCINQLNYEFAICQGSCALAGTDPRCPREG